MMDIPEIVRQHILKTYGRMPETEHEWNIYLDMITLGKKYEAALILSKRFSKKFFKKYGLKTPEELRAEIENH